MAESYIAMSAHPTGVMYRRPARRTILCNAASARLQPTAATTRETIHEHISICPESYHIPTMGCAATPGSPDSTSQSIAQEEQSLLASDQTNKTYQIKTWVTKSHADTARIYGTRAPIRLTLQ
jgi:hypothetical protein